MNLPNKITIFRMLVVIAILVLALLPKGTASELSIVSIADFKRPLFSKFISAFIFLLSFNYGRLSVRLRSNAMTARVKSSTKGAI